MKDNAAVLVLALVAIAVCGAGAIAMSSAAERTAAYALDATATREANPGVVNTIQEYRAAENDETPSSAIPFPLLCLSLIAFLALATPALNAARQVIRQWRLLRRRRPAPRQAPVIEGQSYYHPPAAPLPEPALPEEGVQWFDE